MDRPATFNTLNEMESSTWLADIKNQFDNNIWPSECSRCQQAEQANIKSVRQIANEEHAKFLSVNEDYLIIDITMNTLCNAACIICSHEISSTIATLKGIPINKFNGVDSVELIDKNRIVQLDITGGEPGASKQSKEFLQSLSNYPALKKIHLSTNGSMFIPEIESMLQRNIEVDLVISMDGTKEVFEYCRYPLKWDKFVDNVKRYKELQKQYSNLSLLLWTSVSTMCLADLPNMINFAYSVGIHINGNAIQVPEAICINKTNSITTSAKDILATSEHEFARNMSKITAIESVNNDIELVEFLKENDRVRNTNYSKLERVMGLEPTTSTLAR